MFAQPRRAEMSLRQGKKRFAKTFRHMPVAITIGGVYGQVLCGIDAALTRLTG